MVKKILNFYQFQYQSFWYNLYIANGTKLNERMASILTIVDFTDMPIQCKREVFRFKLPAAALG